MDKFTFITEIVKSLAWPIATVSLVFFIRKPLIELIPLLKKLKFKELELEFSKDVQELKAEAALDASYNQENINTSTDNTEHLLNILSLSTRSAIMESWIEVENAAVEVASSLWGQSPSNILRDMPRLGEYLHQCKIIDNRQLSIFNKLRKLRNKSAHVAELHLSESDAREYISMATHLASQLKNSGAVPTNNQTQNE